MSNKKKLEIFIFLLSILLTGCTSLQYQQFQAKACPSGTVLTLPVYAKSNPGDFSAYGGMCLHHLSSEMIDRTARVAMKKGFIVETWTNDYGKCILLEKEGDFYFLGTLRQEIGTDGNTYENYEFSGMVRDVNTSERKIETGLLLPLHIINDPLIRGEMGYSMEEDKWYSCSVHKNGKAQGLKEVKTQFIEFYNRANFCVVQEENDKLLLQIGEIEVNIEFREEYDQNYFSISIQ